MPPYPAPPCPALPRPLPACSLTGASCCYCLCGLKSQSVSQSVKQSVSQLVAFVFPFEYEFIFLNVLIDVQAVDGSIKERLSVVAVGWSFQWCYCGGDAAAAVAAAAAPAWPPLSVL